jgi:hypothetical protein
MNSDLALVIGDSHARKGVPNSRYTWAGRLAVDRRPKYIFNMGDWYDMPSLSRYDKGTKAFEGRRYNDDIRYGNDAINRFELELADAPSYDPTKIALKGNHEQRIDRFANSNAEFAGKVDCGDMEWAENGWKLVEYQKPVVVNGIAFAHNIRNPGSDREMSGENLAANIVKKKHMSCVVAHNHKRGFFEHTTMTGKKIIGLVAGCYLDPNQVETYAGEDQKSWWSGLILLHGMKDGYFDPEFIGINEVKKLYG